MASGLRSRWEWNKHSKYIVKEMMNILKVDNRMEVIPKVKKLVEENDKLAEQNSCLLKEFDKKKIGVRVITNRDKNTGHNLKGVIYFNGLHIGKKVMIWEK